MSNFTDIIAVLVYLDRKKTRSYVGKLTQEIVSGEPLFFFKYDPKYLKREYAIPLGLELPLSEKTYQSISLFPSFQDRIPSKENPAYPDYCKDAGISEQEENPIILLSTVGKRGPSSFIFEPEIKNQFSINDLKKYRENLGLTIREFAALFSISASHLQRIESGKFPGKDILRILEIYSKFPSVALEEIKRNSKAIHTNKYRNVLNFLKNKINPTMSLKEPGAWADILDEREVKNTLVLIKKIKNLDWANKILNNEKIKRSISCAQGYKLYIIKVDKKPTMNELDKDKIPTLIKTNSGEILVYGKNISGEPQLIPLTEADQRKINIEFSDIPYELPVSMSPKPEIYFLLNGEYHNHFNRDEVINIKSCFFELRFAYAIYLSGLEAEYEFKNNGSKNKKSVDFRISGKRTKNEFLVELTSLRDSDAVKEATQQIKNLEATSQLERLHVFSSTSTNSTFIHNDSPEDREIIRVQKAILEKAKKFREISHKTYHIIVIDMRGFLIGVSDMFHYHHIVYGGKDLDDVHKRYFSNANEKNLIKGVFEESYPTPEARKKIHAIGFILEKNYTENEIKSKTNLFINPSLITTKNEEALLKKLFEGW